MIEWPSAHPPSKGKCGVGEVEQGNAKLWFAYMVRIMNNEYEGTRAIPQYASFRSEFTSSDSKPIMVPLHPYLKYMDF